MFSSRRLVITPILLMRLRVCPPFGPHSFSGLLTPRPLSLTLPDSIKYANRASDSDMLPASSQAAGAVQTATQAHNQPYAAYSPGYGFYFHQGLGFAQGLYSATQPAIYPVAQAQTNASAGSAFAKPNTAANYGSHSYNSGYDSLGGAVAQSQDYVNKSYQQQLPQHKQMSGSNSADMSGNNPQSMYNKSHSQLNKVSFRVFRE